jgi:hypothetical protein
MMMPTLHPRYRIVARAHFEIQGAISKAIREHDLTAAELIHILADEISAWSGYAIRDEREQGLAGTDNNPSPDSENTGKEQN